MPNKLTDTEVKKALDSYKTDIGCAKCGFKDKYLLAVLDNALDLINRQDFKIHQLEKQVSEIQNANLIDFNATIGNYKAENESLKAEVERLKNLTLEKCCDNCVHEEKTLQADPCCECFNYRNFTPKNYLKQIKAEAYEEAFEKLRVKLDPTLIAVTMIGSVLVQVSKSHISADNAIEKIREYLKGLEIETRLSFDLAVDNLLNELVGDVGEK